jgi:DNA-binding CsgD family transcriptional regulator
MLRGGVDLRYAGSRRMEGRPRAPPLDAMASNSLPLVAGSTAARKTFALWALLALQTGCALFFLADIATDMLGLGTILGGILHNDVELVAVLVLSVSVILTSREIRRVLIRQRRIEQQLKAASGAFLELVEASFDAWSLTPSERDVALLAIKGLSIAEIAQLRNTKEGTVKAQCNAIYGKAGVTGRPQLLSLFIEELMDDGFLGEHAGPR